MCDPVSIGLGAATAASKGFGAYAKHQEGQMKADAANAAAINRYNNDLELKAFKDNARADVYRAMPLACKAPCLASSSTT